MTLRSRKEYLQITTQHYQTTDKAAKTTILDGFCAACNCNREYAIWLLNIKK